MGMSFLCQGKREGGGEEEGEREREGERKRERRKRKAGGDVLGFV